MIFNCAWSKFLREKNTAKAAIILMLAFMQNLRFGSCAEDAGLAM